MTYEKTIDEIQSLGDLAVIPVGSLEQHSRHLPINTDVVIAQAFADCLGERLDAFVLPCLPISTCFEHKGKKGSVWMNADTFFAMMRDIILNLKDQGFRRIVIIRGHGGIFVMDPIVRQLNSRHMPELMICLLDPYYENIADIFETAGDIHAGEIETSLMLHLRPELVKQELAVDCIPDEPRPFMQYGSMFRYSPDGVWGRPTLATAEKGRRYFAACLDEGEKYINRIFAMTSGRPY